jgi:hypothetical protein
MSYASASEYLGVYKLPDSSLNRQKYIQHQSHESSPLKWVRSRITNAADPKIWGPAFWYSLHTSAAFYPEAPSPIVRERMKYRILAIPYEIPCHACRSHAIAFIEKHANQLEDIVSSKHKLGKFYVDFHNQVNRRYNKPEWTYEQAYAYYSGQDGEITHLKY